MFGGMTTYRARPADGQKDDATLFREMLEIVFKAPEWLHWNQAPGEGIERGDVHALRRRSDRRA